MCNAHIGLGRRLGLRIQIECSSRNARRTHGCSNSICHYKMLESFPFTHGRNFSYIPGCGKGTDYTVTLLKRLYRAASLDNFAHELMSHDETGLGGLDAPEGVQITSLSHQWAHSHLRRLLHNSPPAKRGIAHLDHHILRLLHGGDRPLLDCNLERLMEHNHLHRTGV